MERSDDTFRYCRGFLVSVKDTPRSIPAGYEQRSEHLWVPSDLEIAEARDSNAEVWILGIVADTSSAERTSAEIANHLCHQLADSERSFLDATNDLAGRFLILFKERYGPLRLVGDACGTRPIAFSSQSGLAAMHAKLVADNLNGAPVAVSHTPYRNGYPGRGTPYPGVLLLTPNTVLTLDNGGIERFYPRSPLGEAGVSSVVDDVLTRLGRCLRALAAQRPLLLSLTGGQDSRATLSAALACGIRIEAFTYVTADRSTRADADRARELCAHLGISHEVVMAGPDRPLRASFAKIMKENTYSRHGYLVYQQALEAFGSRNMFHVRSNLVEIGRGFWAAFSVDAETTEGMVQVFTRFQRKDLSNDELARVIALFEDFRVATDFTSASRQRIDARQLFYWEHRMASWLAQVIIEGDPAFETVIPWNCRRLLEALLSVSWDEQQSGAVIEELIRRQKLDRWPVC